MIERAASASSSLLPRPREVHSLPSFNAQAAKSLWVVVTHKTKSICVARTPELRDRNNKEYGAVQVVCNRDKLSSLCIGDWLHIVIHPSSDDRFSHIAVVDSPDLIEHIPHNEIAPRWNLRQSITNGVLSFKLEFNLQNAVKNKIHGEYILYSVENFPVRAPCERLDKYLCGSLYADRRITADVYAIAPVKNRAEWLQIADLAPITEL